MLQYAALRQSRDTWSLSGTFIYDTLGLPLNAVPAQQASRIVVDRASARMNYIPVGGNTNSDRTEPFLVSLLFPPAKNGSLTIIDGDSFPLWPLALGGLVNAGADVDVEFPGGLPLRVNKSLSLATAMLAPPGLEAVVDFQLEGHREGVPANLPPAVINAFVSGPWSVINMVDAGFFFFGAGILGAGVVLDTTPGDVLPPTGIIAPGTNQIYSIQGLAATLLGVTPLVNDAPTVGMIASSLLARTGGPPVTVATFPGPDWTGSHSTQPDLSDPPFVLPTNTGLGVALQALASDMPATWLYSLNGYGRIGAPPGVLPTITYP